MVLCPQIREGGRAGEGAARTQNHGFVSADSVCGGAGQADWRGDRHGHKTMVLCPQAKMFSSRVLLSSGGGHLDFRCGF